jgi:hypothetical protein
MILTISCIIFALGPSLRLVGSTTFTEYKLPVILPYALLTGLPGLDFMRTPGRFMLVGYVALGMAAAYGLQALVQQWNQLAKIVVPAICTGLLLLETWPPMPRPMEQLPAVSDFYRMLGQESEFYGILDLPIRPEQVTTFSNWHLYISSYYQMYQMYHKKGIATGYLSRYYDTHPTLGYLISENSLQDTPLRFDVTIDGKPVDVYANLEHELARNNHRYVVLHKPQPGIPEMKENSSGLLAARRLVDTVFAGRKPSYEDVLITVYHVSPLDTQPLTPNFLLFDRTDYAGLDTSGRRWIHSPARCLVTSLVPQMAELEIKPLVFHDTAKDQYFDRGRITVESENGLIHPSTTMTVNGVGRIPVALTTGSQIITVTITSDGVAQRPLMMSANAVNLETTDNFSAGCDLYIDSFLQPCQDKREFGGDHPVAAYGTGWYEGEGDGIIRWRWSTSPSTLWLYSPTQRKFQVRIRPVALHDPASLDGKGAAGVINVLFNGSHPQQEAVAIGRVTAIDMEANQGWNVITLDLASGNFRPVDIDSLVNDYRPLSFAVEPIKIYFDQDPVEEP